MTGALADKVILVTGAAAGIGAAIATEAAETGAKGLFLTDRDETGLFATAQALSETDTQVSSLAVDLSDISAPAAVISAALDAFGQIDGLVNSAGLTTRASLIDGTPEAWETLFAINARAPFFLMQAVIAEMTARGQPGSIVNISSMNAHCGEPDLAIYAATKGALNTLTKNAANAHLADRIRVNAINLGWTETESERRMQAETLGKGPGWQTEAAKALPLQRLLHPEEAARLAVYLLSDASAPMTGVCMDLEQTVVGAPG